MFFFSFFLSFIFFFRNLSGLNQHRLFFFYDSKLGDYSILTIPPLLCAFRPDFSSVSFSLFLYISSRLSSKKSPFFFPPAWHILPQKHHPKQCKSHIQTHSQTFLSNVSWNNVSAMNLFEKKGFHFLWTNKNTMIR